MHVTRKLKSRRFRRVCVLTGATMTAWLALAAPAPAALIDPALPAYTESLTGHTDATPDATSLHDNFGSTADENQRNESLLGFIPEEDAQTQEEERSQSDWCLWFALVQSAYQIEQSSDSSSNTPEQILVNNLSPCLANRIPSLGSNGASLAASTLAVQYQIQLVQSQSPDLSAQDALSWLQQNGLSFDPQTWADWFTFAAQSLPPSNTV